MTKSYQPAWHKSPIDLPQKTIGKFSVKHRVVTGKTPVIGMRQAYTRGISPLNAKLDKPLLIHELHEKEHGLWMTDLLKNSIKSRKCCTTLDHRAGYWSGDWG